jgi:aspartate aminotransferase
MPVSRLVKANLGRASWIRRMFEEGQRLRALRGTDEVYDFSIGNPDIEPPAAFRDTMARLVADPEPGRHGYMPNPGYASVREAVARMASVEQGVQLVADNIVMTAGAAGGLNIILKTILDPGDEVVVVRPYFAEYFFYVQNHGGILAPVDAGPGFALSAKNLRKALSPHTACVILNSPNNPTGVVYSKEELEAVADTLREHGRTTGRMPYLVADEPYRRIVYDGTAVPPVMAAYPETIVVSSWSKSLSLPGERIGYIAISPRCADAEELFAGMSMSTRVLGFVNAPALMQRAVAELLDERADVASYARRRDLLARGLEAAGYEFPFPSGAFYIFARVPGFPLEDETTAADDSRSTSSAEDLGLDIAFVMHLKNYGILAVPGVGFGCPGWFRVSYCVSERIIERALPMFFRAIEEWKADR